MNINKLAKVALVGSLVVMATFSVMKLSKADTSNCSDPRSVLVGNIISTGEFGGGALATVTNNSDCSFDIGFASYKMTNISPDPRTDQQLFDSATTQIGPNQSLELHINVPDCRYQLDLFHGPVMSVPNYDSVALDNAFVRDNLCTAPETFVNLNFIVKDVCTNNPVSNALVTINQNFGNGSTRTTDGGGFSNFGVLTNKTIGWSVSANGFSTANGNVSSGTNDKTVNVTLNRICAVPTPTPTYTPTPTPTYTPTPTPTYTPTPTPTPVIVTASITANPTSICVGQSSVISWSTSNASQVFINQLGSVNANGSQIVTPAQTTTYTINAVNFNGNSDSDSVTVYVNSCSLPILTPILNISKMVRNVSSNTSEVKSVNANGNDTVEFVLRVSVSNSQTANNVRVTDSLPYGLNYMPGSTTVDNSYFSDGITSGGLNLGTFYAGRLATIRFRATVTQGYNYNYNQYNYGYYNSTTLTNSASVLADNTSSVSDSASVFVANNIQPNQGTLTIQKTGRNITRGDNSPQTSLTARAGDGIEFTITVTAPYNTSLNNVVISDALPAGMNYTARSTTLNNVVTTDGIVAGGLNIGSLSSGQQAVIKFYATINAGLPVNQQLINTASARADNVSSVMSQPVYITIGSPSVIKKALHVPTGPTEDAFALAGLGGLMASAIYVGRRKILGLVRLA